MIGLTVIIMSRDIKHSGMYKYYRWSDFSYVNRTLLPKSQTYIVNATM